MQSIACKSRCDPSRQWAIIISCRVFYFEKTFQTIKIARLTDILTRGCQDREEMHNAFRESTSHLMLESYIRLHLKTSQHELA